ncbi:MAG: 50S ribosomal protein L4 [Gemmatimonadota bacterium]|nr:50S ribosomal protein L4 [Gemmatimonadota bacterium]MDQ6888419.1 50S ribosomal protein L4 [Gemmatimonadota bacterium]
MPESTQMDAAAFTGKGTSRDRVPLPADLFDGTVNLAVLHQAVKAYLANQRQGNASTKIRKYVVGGNQKPWKQKGTGRARQGSIRAPQWVGGGTVFGPTPRSYAQYVPRQVRALARKSAFNARAREGAVVVVDRFTFDAPKTSHMAALLGRLDLTEQKVLILTAGVNQHVYLSARNLPGVQVLPYQDVSAYHILWSDVVVIEAPALGEPLPPVTETESPANAPVRKGGGATKSASQKRASAAKTVNDKKSKDAKSARKASTKASAKKPAAKKSAAKKAPPKKRKGK